jgi:2-(1,2-epoxy-1,2-dihydrophenyl)acetyl-CoA isomerase
MTFETMRMDVAGGIATITLNRPDAFNALNMQMGKELMQAAIRCDEDRSIRCVVLTGTGNAFCAGGDMRSFAEDPARTPALMKELTVYLHAAVSRFSRMNAPVIGAINGVAAGGGLSLAACVDLAIAAEGARFVSAYTAAGLTPDGSSTYFMPRLVGLRRYLEFAMTNRTLTAAEALDWGIVNKVVPADKLMAETMALARQLADGPTRAFGAVKQLANSSFGETLETQMELEARCIAEAARGRDGQEGIAAFVGKRKPSFTGQ